MSNPITVSVVQSDPKVGKEKFSYNLNESKKWIAKAVQEKSDVIVFPELNATGYVFENRKEAYEHASLAENALELWESLARKHSIYIAGSYVERDGEKLFDTSILFGPKGEVGKYRKTHLWNRENLFFEKGNLGYPVFDTEIGKMGMLICWDTWFPETFRIMGVKEADLVLTLNNWVYTPGPLFDDSGRCMALYHTMCAAQANGIFIAAADRVGTERGATFLGNSAIIGPNGWEISRADKEGEVLLTETIDLSLSREKHWSQYNSILDDRRIDLYDKTLGYKG